MLNTNTTDTFTLPRVLPQSKEKETVDVQRIKIIQLLGRIPTEGLHKVNMNWGVKLLYKIGKYNFSVNIPDKLQIQDFTTANIVYEINYIVKNKKGESNSFSIRSYLAKKPEFVFPINNDSVGVVASYIAKLLGCNYDNALEHLKKIKL